MSISIEEKVIGKRVEVGDLQSENSLYFPKREYVRVFIHDWQGYITVMNNS